jgi:hypothetical protein
MQVMHLCPGLGAADPPEIKHNGTQGPQGIQEAKQRPQLLQSSRRLGMLRQRVGCTHTQRAGREAALVGPETARRDRIEDNFNEVLLHHSVCSGLHPRCRTAHQPQCQRRPVPDTL